MKVEYMNPDLIFSTEKPYFRIQDSKNDYFDKSEIGIECYLQILPSVALFGFKYVVILDHRNKVLDGNSRVYSARELGIEVPCIFAKNREALPDLLYKIIWRIRKIIKINYLFQRKIKNPSFRFESIVLLCKFQKNILEGEN